MSPTDHIQNLEGQPRTQGGQLTYSGNRNDRRDLEQLQVDGGHFVCLDSCGELPFPSSQLDVILSCASFPLLPVS